jgi:hypothetical protein
MGEWRDISTAPRDGTDIIAYCDGACTPTSNVTWWNDGWRLWMDADKFVNPGVTEWFPTHWQPLPEPSDPIAPYDQAIGALKAARHRIGFVMDVGEPHERDEWIALAEQIDAALIASSPQKGGE